MTLNTALNQDRRAKDESVHVARGFKGRTIEATILDTGTTVTVNFEANGKLVGLLVEHPSNGTATLTVAIYPKDIITAAGLMFSKAGLAQNADHFVDVQSETINNTPVYLFQHHALVVTSSAAVGADTTIKVIPILARH